MLLSYLVLVLLILQVPGVFFKCVDLLICGIFVGTRVLVFSVPVFRIPRTLFHTETVLPPY